MAVTIPKTSVYGCKEGDKGIAVFAVQRVLNKLGYPTAEDMAFGPKTKAQVVKLQVRLNVPTDGAVGPLTQRKLADYLCARQEAVNDLPDGLVWSQVAYESGGILGAVNWSVPGGVDCGVTQRRVYKDDYANDAVIKRAFDPIYQIDLMGDRVAELAAIFRQRPGVGGNRELAVRLAVLNHNYPYAADQISRKGLGGVSSYFDEPAAWVKTHGIKFPNGKAVETPMHWCQRYSLGAKAWDEPGQAVKLVRSWS